MRVDPSYSLTKQDYGLMFLFKNIYKDQSPVENNISGIIPLGIALVIALVLVLGFFSSNNLEKLKYY
jgi:hypothetical protein